MKISSPTVANLQTSFRHVVYERFQTFTYSNRPDRVARLAERLVSIGKVVGSIPEGKYRPKMIRPCDWTFETKSLFVIRSLENHISTVYS